MSNRKQSYCAEMLESNLEELRRREDMESLRPFVIAEQCFMPHKDVDTAPITMEELKKLARAWKLHERRNFWKMHTTKDSMSAVLLQHIADNGLMPPHRGVKKEPETARFQPAPPPTIRPSATSKVNMKNYCGIPFYFNKECNARELISSSRFIRPPRPEDSVLSLVGNWRAADFSGNNGEVAGNGNGSVSTPNSQGEGGVVGSEEEDAQVTLLKHRNLSVHLVKYSANLDTEAEMLTSKSVQVFLTVAESSDPQTVSNCIIAISNICSSAHVRNILLELNAVHKLAAMIPMLRGAKAVWAAGLLFYYFSLERDIEDRIYNTSFALLKNNGSSEDNYSLRMLSLFTLNNLLPCIERQRVTELIIATASPFFSAAEGTLLKEHSVLLDIILNICYFANTHFTLMELDLMDMLSMLAAAAAANEDEVIALKIVRILGAFMHSPELAEQLLAADYVSIFIDLLSIRDPSIIRESFRILAVMSSLEALMDSVCDSDVVRVVCSVTLEADITIPAAVEVAKYFANICQSRVEDYSKQLLKDGAAHAIIKLIQNPYPPDQVACIALKGLQNLLAYKSNCEQLVNEVWEPLLVLISKHNIVDAGYCLYNVACVAECEEVLVSHKIHSQILERMCKTKDDNARSSFVQILVQLAHNKQCVEDLLGEDVITKIEATLSSGGSGSSGAAGMNESLWIDVSQMLLALVVKKADLDGGHRVGIVRILSKICTAQATEQVINNCAKILAYLSLSISDFPQMDPVIGSILTLSDSDTVMESMSIVLYNVTCTEEHAMRLLQSGKYLNTMIRMMRNAKPAVQENIAYGMRTLCALPACTAQLLQQDLLSDFVVIALLRTSSEAIKSVCSESFFNMLCQQEYRQKLLRGDLWWAMMRLSRSNYGKVRLICAKALFNLACDPKNMQPLRDNNVLALVKEISATGSADFLEICLQAVQNIVAQFDNHVTETEVLSVLRICADVLSRCDSFQSRSCSLKLLMRCAQQCNDNAILEFVTVDIANNINQTRSKWMHEVVCCETIGYLTRSISRSSDYTKATQLADIDDTLNCLFYADAPLELYENVAAIVLLYVSRAHVTPAVLVTLSTWKRLLGSNPFGELAEKEARTSPNLRIMMLSIIVYVLNQSLDHPSVGMTVPSDIIRDILKVPVQLRNDPMYQPNLMYLIFKASLNAELGLCLLQSGVCGLLSEWINDSVHSTKARENTTGSMYMSSAQQAQAQQQIQVALERKARVYQYCSVVLRNLALHPSLLPELVQTKEADVLLFLLCNGRQSAISLDVATVLYFCSRNQLLRNEFLVNPQLVLNAVSLLNEINVPIAENAFQSYSSEDVDQAALVNRVTKHIVTIVLNEYSIGEGVHPSFIQSMYTEMKDKSSADIPALMETQALTKELKQLSALIPYSVFSKCPVVEYEPFVEKETQWNTIVECEKKQVSADFYHRRVGEPIISTEIQSVELPDTVEYNKIRKTYALVSLD